MVYVVLKNVQIALRGKYQRRSLGGEKMREGMYLYSILDLSKAKIEKHLTVNSRSKRDQFWGKNYLYLTLR